MSQVWPRVWCTLCLLTLRCCSIMHGVMGRQEALGFLLHTLPQINVWYECVRVHKCKLVYMHTFILPSRSDRRKELSEQDRSCQEVVRWHWWWQRLSVTDKNHLNQIFLLAKVQNLTWQQTSWWKWSACEQDSKIRSFLESIVCYRNIQ